MAELSDDQYQVLLVFRRALRHYLAWSAELAEKLGLTPQQHQLLLAVRGHPGPHAPSIGDVAEYLLIRHHSAVELASRVEKLGLLSRQPDDDDHRVVRLRLTERGEKLIEDLAVTHLAELQRVAGRLDITEDLLGRLSAEFVDSLGIGMHGADTAG